MLEVAERRKSTATLADATHAQGVTLFWCGHLSDALTAINRAIVLCPDGAGRISFNVPDPLVESLAYAAVSTWTIGYPDRAAELLESAAKRSRDLNQRLSLASHSFMRLGFVRGAAKYFLLSRCANSSRHWRRREDSLRILR
jgi:hypothetical protein